MTLLLLDEKYLQERGEGMQRWANKRYTILVRIIAALVFLVY